MLTINIFKAIDEMIPKELALKEDKIGYFGINYQNSEIKNIKIMMDILPKNDDSFNKGDLVITHHPQFSHQEHQHIQSHKLGCL